MLLVLDNFNRTLCEIWSCHFFSLNARIPVFLVCCCWGVYGTATSGYNNKKECTTLQQVNQSRFYPPTGGLPSYQLGPIAFQNAIKLWSLVSSCIERGGVRDTTRLFSSSRCFCMPMHCRNWRKLRRTELGRSVPLPTPADNRMTTCMRRLACELPALSSIRYWWGDSNMGSLATALPRDRISARKVELVTHPFHSILALRACLFWIIFSVFKWFCSISINF